MYVTLHKNEKSVSTFVWLGIPVALPIKELHVLLTILVSHKAEYYERDHIIHGGFGDDM